MEFLDANPRVRTFSSLEGAFAIPYKLDGKSRVYYPDLQATLCSGKKLLIEVKSTWTLDGKPSYASVNAAKFSAAEQACGTRGWTFWLALVKGKQIKWFQNPSRLFK